MIRSELEEFQSQVQDVFLEDLGDDFDFYIDQDECLDPERLALAMEKGMSPREYADEYIYRRVI